jgi:RNA polymerase sigma factor for flagellar operon FliA
MTTTAAFDTFLGENERPSGVMRIAPAAITSAEVAENMPLVHGIVARILRRLPRSVLREDLVAAGSHGLMDALRRSPGPRDARFEAYAKIRIRGAIIDELRSQDWLARAARADANAKARASDTSATMVIGFDDLPESQQVAASSDASPFDQAARVSERSALAKAVLSLPEREARIVDLHYFQGVPFKAIAASLGVSEPRISQLHARALAKLRPLLEANLRCAAA